MFPAQKQFIKGFQLWQFYGWAVEQNMQRYPLKRLGEFLFPGYGGSPTISLDPLGNAPPTSNAYIWEWINCDVNSGISGSGPPVYSGAAQTIPPPLCLDFGGSPADQFDPSIKGAVPGVGFGWYDPQTNQGYLNATIHQLRTDSLPGFVYFEWGMWDGYPDPSYVGGPIVYTRPDYGPVSVPTYWPVPVPVRWGDPANLPIQKAIPVPKPNAWAEALPGPGMQPSNQPRPGPQVNPRTATFELPPFPVGLPFPPLISVPPSITPTPGQPPVIVQPPTVVISPNPVPGQPPVVTTSPGSPGRTPEGPGQKGRKPHMTNTPSQTVLTAINVFTESLDFFDSLYAAVKPLTKKKCAARDYACKAGVIYDHFDDERFDAALFIENWINNQFEDYLFGMLGKAGGKASAGIGLTTGLSRGTNTGGKVAGDLEDAQLGTPLPKLDYDPDTGAWAITWEAFGIHVPLYRR